MDGLIMALAGLFIGTAIAGVVWGWFAINIVLRHRVRQRLEEIRALEKRKEELERRNLELSGRIMAQADLWYGNGREDGFEGIYELVEELE